MPCQDYPSSYHTETKIVYKNGSDPRTEFELTKQIRRNRELNDRNNELAQMLCAVGRARMSKTPIPVSVLKWWDDHCRMDRLHGEPWDIDHKD